MEDGPPELPIYPGGLVLNELLSYYEDLTVETSGYLCECVHCMANIGGDSATSSLAMSWRLSPSSSGYKSQSQRSDSVTPSPTATPLLTTVTQQPSVDDAQNPTTGQGSWDDGSSSPSQITRTQSESDTVTTSQASSDYGNNNHNQEMVWSNLNQHPPKRPTMMWHPHMNYTPHNTNNDAHQNNKPAENNQPTSIMWAITDLKEVPKGSHIINSETGAPFKNPDGTDYAFDPNNLHPSLALMLQSSEASMAGNNNSQIPPPNMSTPQPETPGYQNNKANNISNMQKPTYNNSKPTLQRSNSKTLYNNQYSQGQKTYIPSQNNKQSPPPPPPPPAPAPPTSTATKPPIPGNGKSPPNGTAKPANSQSPAKKVDTVSSPKKFSKFQPKNSLGPAKPNGARGFTNTATSPSLPYSSSGQVQYNQSTSYQYVQNSQYENASSMPMATFPLSYGNNAQVYASGPMVPVHNSNGMQVYGDEASSMVYGYGVPQYPRMDSVSDLNNYFVNMNLNSDVATNATNNSQQIAYQGASPYWGHQPMVCYVPPQNAAAAQRYPVPLVQGQSGYLSAYASQQTAGQTNYATGMASGGQQQANTELLPLYQQGPPPLVYGHPPPVVAAGGQPISNHTTGASIVYANQPPPNAIMYTPNMSQIYTATPNIVYSPNNNSNASMYPVTNTPNSTYSNNSTYTQSSVYSGPDNKNNTRKNYNSMRNSRSNAPTSNNNTATNSSSASSNSPASTVVQTHYNQYTGSGVPFNRHISPSETPPTTYPAGFTYGYPHFQQGPMPPTHILPPQSAMVYRNNVQVAIRASPPVNSRTSRSPTPSVDPYDRNTRYPMASSLYQVPCVVPGDMRFMTPRPQLPPYKNAYNRPPFPQNMDSQLGRPPKIRKPRN